MNILLTNDDSHDSPLFHLAITHLQKFGELTVVVPAEEQSWKGKSMTRFGPLYVEKIDIHGTPAYSVTGTPADCASLAIYNLMDVKPDIVVSGINIGVNTGIGFMLASGTIGACFEGNIAGIPGLALSQQLLFEDFQYWHDNRRMQDKTVAQFDTALTQVLPTIWSELVNNQQPQAMTWNVNFPSTLTSTDIVRTRMGHTYYQRCFSERGDQYFHDLERFPIDTDADTDAAVLGTGRVSATKIDLSVIGQQI